MLKFQKNYTTTLATFEDLIIIAYVILDDLYQHIAPGGFREAQRPTGSRRFQRIYPATGGNRGLGRC